MSDPTAITTVPHGLSVIRPTRWTLFWRTFVPWQFIRFLVINLKMTAMIMKSHDTRLSARPRPPLPPPVSPVSVPRSA